MKKLLISSMLIFAVCSCAQQYPTISSNGRTENSNYNNNNSYSSNDNNDYPDDYYYDYPTDYYPQSYYQSYFNDYRNSIVSINWDQFYRRYNLSPDQIQRIIYLNQQYSDFNSWNSYYSVNPDRWYYERFFAMRNILGPQIFVVYQRNYYHGYNPVVYFQNYRRSYYQPRYNINVQYRNVNITRYKIDRTTFVDRRDNSGLYNPNRRNNTNNFQKAAPDNNGFRNNVRTDTSTPSRNTLPVERAKDSGFRNGNSTEVIQPLRNSISTDNNKNNGFRTGNKPESPQPIRTLKSAENMREDGFRTGNKPENMQPEKTVRPTENIKDTRFRSENSSQKPQNAGPRINQNRSQTGRAGRMEMRATRKAQKVETPNDSRGGGFR